MESGQRIRVGIACQGGGSHTAFTAGVLQRLMESLPEDVDVVALSGTSGGAICAALAWAGLVRNDRALAVRKLRSFWSAMAAREPWDRAVNEAMLAAMAMRDLMVLPEVSPYRLPTWGEEHFREIIAAHFEFDELKELARRPGAPILRIGAVEVLSGHFELFGGQDLSVDCLLASAGLPELFRAVRVAGRGVFWDGLFSQNPPIHDLIEHKLDELWLIQINSSTCSTVPTETHEIMDRRNALAGNLSMEQELGFIEFINRVIRSGKVNELGMRPIRVARIALDRELGYRTKLDRNPEFLDGLMEYGQAKCRWFLRERRAAGAEARSHNGAPQELHANGR
jgi:NTE family protein